MNRVGSDARMYVCDMTTECEQCGMRIENLRDNYNEQCTAGMGNAKHDDGTDERGEECAGGGTYNRLMRWVVIIVMCCDRVHAETPRVLNLY